MKRLQVLLYCVTRVGIGHFMRTRAIARATAEHHHSHLVDDGAPVPDLAADAKIQRIRIPAVIREGAEIIPHADGPTLTETLAERGDRLIEAVRRIRPDALLIEHFPFSKLEHREEIVGMIEAAREIHPHVLVLCSIRDLAPEPNYRQVDADYRQEVLSLLQQHFDAVLVHADERFARLEHSLKWADAIQLPLFYTGFVAEAMNQQASPLRGHAADRTPGEIIVSGGGRRDASLYESCAKAWQELKRRGTLGGRKMILIAPAGVSPEAILNQDQRIGIEDLTMEAFSASLLERMLGADLSISHSGYNTCMNILTTRARAILIPNQNSSDQLQRAQRMEQLGLCRMLPANDLQPARLADIIEQHLASPPTSHQFRLDGAERSIAILEDLAFRKEASRHRAAPRQSEYSD